VSATPAPRFLTASWRNLAMLNYEIDPQILSARVPAGCELDSFGGRTFVSVVGFQFLTTRVLGIAIPFHTDFVEVNLRYYVRRFVDGQWRRGVVFVKELVPRRAIAFTARAVYGENYAALPMRHTVTRADDGMPTALRYEWRRHGSWEGLFMSFSGRPKTPAGDSEETFITDHYWGYSKQRGRATIEYQVEHLPWRVWEADASELSCDVGSLYGSEFVDALSLPPHSAFAAEGSAIVVRGGRRIRGS
jgi:uncharacterized protein YqjF (DUF2071 family)